MDKRIVKLMRAIQGVISLNFLNFGYHYQAGVTAKSGRHTYLAPLIVPAVHTKVGL